MTTATLEKPSTPFGASSAATIPPTPARAGAARGKIVLVGFDLGTNKSCLLAGAPGVTDIAVSKVVPSVTGYVKDGIVDGIIAGNRSVLFGDDALNSALHVRLVTPLAEGVVDDPAAARDFLQHIRTLADRRKSGPWLACPPTPANPRARTSAAPPRASSIAFC